MKRVYEIDIDCPMCAKKVEEHLSKQKEVDSALIDYSSKRLFIELNKELNIDQINKIIQEVEDDASIFEIKENKKSKIFGKEEFILLIRIIVAALFAIGGVVTEHLNPSLNFVYIPLYIVGLLVVLYDIAFSAFKDAFKFKNPFTEDMLVTVASIGACCLYFLGTNAFFEAVMVVLLSQIGELFEDIATKKSTAAIINAVDLRNNNANLLLEDNEVKVVESASLKVGDLIQVKVGERVPCDSIFVSGDGLFDTSSITGEFTPVKLEEGQEVLSGYKLVDGSVTLKVAKEFNESTASKILELVKNSGEKKAKASRFVDKFAKIYTPIIFGLAFLIIVIPSVIYTLLGQTELVTLLGETKGVWNYFLYIGLSVLLIGCPCAVVISIPLSFFAGIGLASKNNIVVKGSNYFDSLTELKTVVVDKTGTITEGVFEVLKQEHKISEKEFNSYVYSLESLSNHPISKAVVKSLKHSNKFEVKNYQELQGMGIIGVIKDKKVAVGNKKLMDKYGVSVEEFDDNLTYVYVCVDNQYIGYLALGDRIKEQSKVFIDEMHKKGIQVAMLSGDNNHSVNYIGKELGLDYYKGSLLPDQKISELEKIMDESNGKVAFVGDGINDSPSIIRSDVGIAMGNIGSDMAVDNADIVIMDDNISRVSKAIDIASATRSKAIANIVVALVVKLTLIVLSLLGLFGSYTMLLSVLADTGLTVLLVLNSLTLLNKKNI